MRRTFHKKASHLARHRVRGQSIPLIALMVVTLFAIVGLSVDVGNTFAEERRAVAAANSAALTGMNYYIKRNNSATNASMYSTIQESLVSNGISLGNNNNELRFSAIYLNNKGEEIAKVTNDGSLAPTNVSYLQVALEGRIDTFFARVTNRPDLPLGAQAFAGICPPTSGVYPIAINAKYLDGTRFIEPSPNTDPKSGDPLWGVMSSPREYAGKTWLRLDPADGSQVPGGFGWMRWMQDKGVGGTNANSAVELGLSLTGDGNLSEGFEELPNWPTGSSTPKPAIYPERPNELNVGDWVAGSSGNTNSNDVKNALNAHISAGTRMILPIYDVADGQGSNSAYRIVRFGVFVLKAMSSNQAQGGWFEFIYMGEPDNMSTACSVAQLAPNETNLALVGDVSLYPEYQYIPKVQQPIQFMVVFDVSGSMNMNFNGQGLNSGKVYQCANGPVGFPAATTCGSPDYAWYPESERRVYVAKEALRNLIRNMNMPGNANYKTNRPADEMSMVWFTNSSPSNWVYNWSTDPAALDQAVLNAGAQNYGGKLQYYMTSGGTNGAAGLYRGSLLLDQRPNKTNFNGEEVTYKRVVIFITDGVSNNFLNVGQNTLSGGSSDAGTYPSGHACNLLGSKVIENAQCQTTSYGGTYESGGFIFDRPITQMGTVSRLIQQDNNTQVYVIALSTIPDTGLKSSVATAPSYFFAADELVKNADGSTNVDTIMESIYTEVSDAKCEARNNGDWQAAVPPEQSGGSAVGLTYPTVGEVFLIAQDGTTLKAPINADTSGKLTYRFSKLQPGTYTLRPYIFYKHPLDGIVRRYSLIFSAEDTASEMVVTVDGTMSAGSLSGEKRQDIQLKLFGDVCATE